ncbi:MAG: Crp/Fnr family transcriptional regulator [Capsulimonadaceae bacterium]
MPSDPHLLSKVLLFQGLPPEQFEIVSRTLRSKSYPARRTLFEGLEPGESVYVVLSGSVKVFDEDVNGLLVVLAILGPGEVVGEMSSMDKLGRSASAITLEPSTIGWVDGATFTDWCRRMPALSHALAEMLSRRLRLANAQIRALSTLAVPGRLARTLLALAREYGRESQGGGTAITVPLTQSDLAGMTGASRVSVNQTLMGWKRSGHISEVMKHVIVVHHLDALRRFCENPEPSDWDRGSI